MILRTLEENSGCNQLTSDGIELREVRLPLKRRDAAWPATRWMAANTAQKVIAKEHNRTWQAMYNGDGDGFPEKKPRPGGAATKPDRQMRPPTDERKDERTIMRCLRRRTSGLRRRLSTGSPGRRVAGWSGPGVVGRFSSCDENRCFARLVVWKRRLLCSAGSDWGLPVDHSF
jgi:hypothetical protein